MEFLSVGVFPKLVLFWGGKCKPKEFLSVYLMVPDHLFFYLSGEVLLHFQIYTSPARIRVCHSRCVRKGYFFNIRMEGITCGPSRKEFGKAEEVCQIETVRDKEQRYIHCCVLPSAVSCLPTRASSFLRCSP